MSYVYLAKRIKNTNCWTLYGVVTQHIRPNFRLKLTKDQRLDHKEEVLSVEIARFSFTTSGNRAKSESELRIVWVSKPPEPKLELTVKAYYCSDSWSWLNFSSSLVKIDWSLLPVFTLSQLICKHTLFKSHLTLPCLVQNETEFVTEVRSLMMLESWKRLWL